MTRIRRCLPWFVTALSLYAAVAAHATPVSSIAHARSLPLGSVVTVFGTATTPSGAFESSFFDKGFAIQDVTAGIYVSLQTDLSVAPRRLVRVTGTLQESFGLRILVPASASDVKLYGNGLGVLPLWIPTGAISEATEGLLVWSFGLVTRGPENDLPYGYKLYINDGSGEVTIFVNTQTGIDLSGISAGQLVIVTGFSSQFDDHYEIDPRFPADLRVWD